MELGTIVFSFTLFYSENIILIKIELKFGPTNIFKFISNPQVRRINLQHHMLKKRICVTENTDAD